MFGVCTVSVQLWHCLCAQQLSFVTGNWLDVNTAAERCTTHASVVAVHPALHAALVAGLLQDLQQCLSSSCRPLTRASTPSTAGRPVGLTAVGVTTGLGCAVALTESSVM